MATIDPTQDAKAALRTTAQQTRKDAASNDPGDAALLIAQALTKALDAGFITPPTTCVSGYLPLGNEIDPRPAMDRLAQQGWTMALPVVVAKNTPLEFREWTPGAPLEDGSLRTRHPAEGARVVNPGLILSPMLSFDAAGYRLGWGGGFYDRTIAERRPSGALFIGCAYSAQQVDNCPRGPYDMALDAVVTEQGFSKVPLIL